MDYSKIKRPRKVSSVVIIACFAFVTFSFVAFSGPMKGNLLERFEWKGSQADSVIKEPVNSGVTRLRIKNRDLDNDAEDKWNNSEHAVIPDQSEDELEDDDGINAGRSIIIDPDVVEDHSHDVVRFRERIRNFSPLAAGQSKRGYDSVIRQLTKPLKCVEKSRWRGPDAPGLCVEDRLDIAFSVRKYWHENASRAIESCGNGEPMMSPSEYGLLYHLLRKGDLMLEWGAGRSSCVWAHVVGELHSIDDSSTWVSMLYSTKNLTQNQVIHWMPSFEAARSVHPPSALDEYSHYAILPFLIAPQCFPHHSNIKYDVILVDGRVRPQCAYYALLLLKRDGILLLHDFESLTTTMRPYYRIILRWFELLHREESLGVFRIRPERTGSEHFAEPGNFPIWWHETVDRNFMNTGVQEKLPWEEPWEEPHAMPADYERLSSKWPRVRNSKTFKRTSELFQSETTA